jgi:hypothetical protein
VEGCISTQGEQTQDGAHDERKSTSSENVMQISHSRNAKHATLHAR